MTVEPLTDLDVESVLRGTLLPDQDELLALADALDAMRVHVDALTPEPSPELDQLFEAGPTVVPLPVGAPSRRRLRRAAAWVSGAGLGVHLALGAAGAAAAVGVAGGAGALPAPLQELFDSTLAGIRGANEGGATPAGGADLRLPLPQNGGSGEHAMRGSLDGSVRRDEAPPPAGTQPRPDGSKAAGPGHSPAAPAGDTDRAPTGTGGSGPGDGPADDADGGTVQKPRSSEADESGETQNGESPDDSSTEAPDETDAESSPYPSPSPEADPTDSTGESSGAD